MLQDSRRKRSHSGQSRSLWVQRGDRPRAVDALDPSHAPRGVHARAVGGRGESRWHSEAKFRVAAQLVHLPSPHAVCAGTAQVQPGFDGQLGRDRQPDSRRCSVRGNRTRQPTFGDDNDDNDVDVVGTKQVKSGTEA